MAMIGHKDAKVASSCAELGDKVQMAASLQVEKHLIDLGYTAQEPQLKLLQ